MRSPGRMRGRRQARRADRAARRRRCRRTCRRRAPRSTTLVSPATICTPAASRRRGDRLDLGAQVVGREALLEDQRERQRQRPRAGDGEVVDGAVDRELADRAAREAQRLDDEGVGRHRELRAVDVERAGVAHRVELRRAEGGDEQALDQALRRLAAGAVGHRDALVAELRALAARGLDDPEDALLAARGRLGARRHQTTSRSRAKRP